MAPQLGDDEIDDLIYFARAGEAADLNEALATLAAREGLSPAQILAAAQDDGRSTCLHMATGNGNLEIVKLLVEHFAGRPPAEKQVFLDAPNAFGNTGLHWAAMGGHLGVVECLVAAGASPALANDKNYIPLDLASFGDKTAVVDYFLSQMDQLESSTGGGLEGAAASMEIADEGEDEEGKEEEGKAKAKAGEGAPPAK